MGRRCTTDRRLSFVDDTKENTMIGSSDLQIYQKQGYLVVSGLFSRAEVQHFIQHYMAMREHEMAGQNQSLGDASSVGANDDDPLKAFPRLMQMHRRDQLSLAWLLDTRLNACLTALLGREPYAVQTMLYFKPPGARGQALHQDQFYLRVQPGTCMAAWMALDDCDEENGCLQVAPGSHTWPVLCTVPADTTTSFTDVTVDLPAGMRWPPRCRAWASASSVRRLSRRWACSSWRLARGDRACFAARRPITPSDATMARPGSRPICACRWRIARRRWYIAGAIHRSASRHLAESFFTFSPNPQ
jgi:hypothetical protein